MKKKQEVIGTGLILLTALISGASIVINKSFVAKVDPLLFTAIRAFFIGIFFFTISFYFSKTQKKKFKKASWTSLLSIGIIGGGFAFWLFFTGLQLTTAGRAAFIHKTLPIYATILAIIFLKERVTKKQLIAMLIMIFGLVLMNLAKLTPDIRIGDLLVLSATILWALENTISKKAMLNKESNWVVTFSRMFFGSLLLFSIIIITGKLNLLFSLTSAQILYTTISATLLLLYVLTWYWGLKHINLSKASTILLISPVITLILSVLFLQEQILLIPLLGSILILTGALVILKTKSEQTNNPI